MQHFRLLVPALIIHCGIIVCVFMLFFFVSVTFLYTAGLHKNHSYYIRGIKAALDKNISAYTLKNVTHKMFMANTEMWEKKNSR